MKEKLFNKLYKETFDDISKYVICATPNINDVNDLLQTIYMEVFKIINKDNYDLLSKAYIKGIAQNKINDYYRYNYKQKFISLFTSKENIEEYKDDIDIEEITIKKYDQEKVWKYLKKNQTVAKIFYLYYNYGLTIPEIAHALNLNESNVKNYLYRTLKKLKKYMKEGQK